MLRCSTWNHSERFSTIRERIIQAGIVNNHPIHENEFIRMNRKSLDGSERVKCK